MDINESILQACGFRGGATAVRVALGIAPVGTSLARHAEKAKNYVQGEDKDERLANTKRTATLMVGLALGGVRSPYIAELVGCSKSAVKLRLRQAGVPLPIGNVRPDAARNYKPRWTPPCTSTNS